jgi:probable HAF family extracellular repeat protein
MRLKWLPSVFVLMFFATSVLAAPQTRYRLTLIASSLEGELTARAMNNRGEVTGVRGASDGNYAFLWTQDGFVDLHGRIDPAASYTESADINDRSQVVGFYVDSQGAFRGFLLDRRQVTEVQGPPSALAASPHAINDREQILGSFYDANGNEGYFLNEEGNVLLFEPGFLPWNINVAGTVAGTYSAADRRAAIWRDGVLTPIAPAPSGAGGINDRGQVIGSISGTGGSRAFVWERGQLTVLPALIQGQTSSYATDINNAGRIVGETDVQEPSGTRQVATVWDNGQVFDLNTLIDLEDPLRAFVTLHTGRLINDRGEIVAVGLDSRVGYLRYFFLEPVRRR